MRTRSKPLLVITVLSVSTPAWPFSERDAADCSQTADLNRQIAGCSRIINGRGEKASIRAAAHNNRANAYKAKGDRDRAIFDYVQALEIAPDSAFARKNFDLVFTTDTPSTERIALKAWLGFEVRGMDSATAAALGWSMPQGVVVARLSGSGPPSGVIVGDVITAIDDHLVGSASDIDAAVEAYRPQDQVNLQIFRQGAWIKVPLTLEEAYKN